MDSETLKIYNTMNIIEGDMVEIILKQVEEYYISKKNEAITFYKFFNRNK